MNKRIKIVVGFIIMCSIGLTIAHADTRVITIDTIRDSVDGVRVEMPCNWNKSLQQTKVIAFYGTDVPFNEQPMDNAKLLVKGSDVIITFPQEIMTPAENGDLHHAELNFRTTNKRCKGSFGFETLSK